MTPECWVCGQLIRQDERAESLPGGPVAVHARCVERDAERGTDRETLAKAA